MKIEKTCKLPGKLILPAIKRVENGCPDNYVCYTVGTAAKMAKREADMIDWIKAVRSRCSSEK